MPAYLAFLQVNLDTSFTFVGIRIYNDMSYSVISIGKTEDSRS